jgi:hypothetical protein
MSEIQRIRPVPKIVKDESGKERTSTGRWSLAAISDHVAVHPETMFDYKKLARIGYNSAFPKDAEAARQNIRSIANLLEARNILTVVEFAGRKIHAIQVYIPLNEYHQKLMADEIGRRKLRADGSADKLEGLIRSLPNPE